MTTVPHDDAHQPELFARIAERIRAAERMTFADFMSMALYEPGLGYYMTDAPRLGRDGDFVTAPEVHPLFGRLVGEQVLDMIKLLTVGRRLDRRPIIIEMGAGRGLLAEDVITLLAERWPDWPRGIDYAIVDVSPAMQARQRARLAPFLDRGASIRWCDTLEDVAPSGCDGVIFSNELIDALPVHRVVMRGGRLLERYVTLEAGRLVDVIDDPSTPALADYFTARGIALPDGFETEVNLRALDWMRAVGRALRHGFVLTIDYGHPAEERYSAPRRIGTLASYAGHRRQENPYARIGRQDLTAHVDFSALVQAGREAGLEPTGFTDQTNFLMGLGAAELMEQRLGALDGVGREVELTAFKLLLAPDGMGRAFKVLIQHKGVEAPSLRGLMFRPFFPPASFSPAGRPFILTISGNINKLGSLCGRIPLDPERGSAAAP